MIIAGMYRCAAMTCLALGLAGATTRVAAAEAPRKPARPTSAAATATAASKSAFESPATVARWAERLKSADLEEVRATLLEIKDAGKRAMPAAPALADLLRRGTTPSVAALALATLAVVGTPAQTGAVAPYAHHRIADLRSKAVVALGTSGGEHAVPTLRRALADIEPAVRGGAASALAGLGAVGARAALSDLYAALDRNVLEAASAIGQLCSGEECTAFAAKTGRLGLDVMISGFDALIFRPSSEVSDDQKVKIVERVRDLRTLEANRYLRDLQSRIGSGAPRVKQAIDEAVVATQGAAS